MTKLRETSETNIALIFLVMNLDKILRDLLSSLLESWLSIVINWKYQAVPACNN
jgi:hypothetical protein